MLLMILLLPACNSANVNAGHNLLCTGPVAQSLDDLIDVILLEGSDQIVVHANRYAQQHDAGCASIAP